MCSRDMIDSHVTNVDCACLCVRSFERNRRSTLFSDCLWEQVLKSGLVKFLKSHVGISVSKN